MRLLEVGWLLLYFITSVASASFIDNRCYCVNDYWVTGALLSCVLNFNGTRHSSPYTLNFSGGCVKKNSQFSCELAQTNGEYSCAVKLPDDCVSTEASLTIDLLHNVSKVHRVQKNFKPSQCIKTRAPLAPVLTQTANWWNLTWTTSYEEHFFQDGDLGFQLLLQSTSDNCFPAKCKSYHPSPHNYMLVEKSKLEPGSLQCAQVRSKPGNEDYRGVWSNWSPQTCWKIEQNSGGQGGVLVLGVLGALLLTLLSISTARFCRKKMKTHIPSPAPFFQPLFRQYDGHLKDWISAHCSYVLEDMLTTEIVIVEFIKKDPEVLQDNPAFPLAKAWTDSSYVGLADLESSLLSAMCPAQSSSTSYTQLPAFLWGEPRSLETYEASVCHQQLLSSVESPNLCSLTNSDSFKPKCDHV